MADQSLKVMETENVLRHSHDTPRYIYKHQGVTYLRVIPNASSSSYITYRSLLASILKIERSYSE